MGQPITVESKPWDAVCVFTTDRSITGQDGAGYHSKEAAEAATEFSARLAARLYDGDDEIEHVYVASNDVIVRRRSRWDDAAVSTTAETIEQLFLHYV